MYPSPPASILPRNHFVWIELSGPQIIRDMNPLFLDLHNMCGSSYLFTTYVAFWLATAVYSPAGVLTAGLLII